MFSVWTRSGPIEGMRARGAKLADGRLNTIG